MNNFSVDYSVYYLRFLSTYVTILSMVRACVRACSKALGLDFECTYFPPFSAAFQFSFGLVTDGSEATSGVDIAVRVIINIIPSTALLPTDTVVTVSVSGGTATGKLIDCSTLTF